MVAKEEAKVLDTTTDKLVVVVIDESRSLLEGRVNHFHMLQRALVSANNTIGGTAVLEILELGFESIVKLGRPLWQSILKDLVGMIKVWYGLIDALKAFILPQFEKLVLNEALAIDRIEEVVVRIVLLLAMDKCVMGDKEIPWCEFTAEVGAKRENARVFVRTSGRGYFSLRRGPIY
ncbi:hypothetical protein F442_12432 [Phytophthora nicotianae P10297]|uniref:Uncharacterized protein n=1 Tax=Phytophthora nicotianae P10297 TaxID=1317064 RepID=W2Z1X2_PHYNI|nr:hypothetical protein F442_12432 [Phytophthora nicotianae P10297]